MALPVRVLDDRRFQDIVDEAKKRIAASCPDWTDHNVSDPGVTMIELFAWMTEMIIYRLNQVPERNYIKFLELLGFQLRAPKPAQTEITFYLSAPQPNPIVIKEKTEVSTVRTETQPAIIFSSVEEFEIRPPELIELRVEEVSEGRFTGLNHKNLHFASVFGATPDIDNALYMGFNNDVGRHVLAVEVDCEYAAPGDIDTKNPAWRWEGWVDTGKTQGWMPAIIEQDTTGGMSESGRIVLRLPPLTNAEIDGKRAFWLRCRVVQPQEGQPRYGESPRLNGIDVLSWGGTVKAVHASVIEKEFLGYSDGSPGQVFQVENTPLLDREHSNEVIEILPPKAKNWESWEEVSNFAETGKKDKKCYTCDSATGEVRFGPALSTPEGVVQSYGAIPPRGSQIRFRAYRFGGGVIGNVQKETLTVLKTSIPYIDRVVNYQDAKGGVDQETIEALQVRAPKYLSARGRAVTADDYETVVHQKFPELARVRCVPADPGTGTIYIFLVPDVDNPSRQLKEEDLNIDRWRRQVEDFLDDRRLLTVQLLVDEPVYSWVSVDISVIARPNADPGRVYQDIETRLYRFLNPIVGGPDETGWPFGRHLSPFDVSICLQTVRGIEFIQSLKLYYIFEFGDRAEITQDEPLHLLAHGLIASADHRIRVERRN